MVNLIDTMGGITRVLPNIVQLMILLMYSIALRRVGMSFVVERALA
mgnify:CR=1